MMLLALALAIAAPPGVAAQTGAALAAVNVCAANGHMVSVAIAGPEGEVRVLLRGDGAAPHTAEAARRKAYTAASFGRPTAAMVELMAKSPDAAGLARLDNTLFVGGGVPILSGGKVIGGVGVSGARGPGSDEICAAVAAERLGERR